MTNIAKFLFIKVFTQSWNFRFFHGPLAHKRLFTQENLNIVDDVGANIVLRQTAGGGNEIWTKLLSAERGLGQIIDGTNRSFGPYHSFHQKLDKVRLILKNYISTAARATDD